MRESKVNIHLTPIVLESHESLLPSTESLSSQTWCVTSFVLTFQKGDVLLVINGHSLINLTHAEAVKVLKSCAESKTLTVNLLEGPETCDGINNFTPTWKYWLSMPK